MRRGIELLGGRRVNMSVSELCGVCQTQMAEFECPQCGTPVCEAHWDRSVGSCIECAPGGGLPGADVV